jgi:hypothetical protein
MSDPSRTVVGLGVMSRYGVKRMAGTRIEQTGISVTAGEAWQIPGPGEIVAVPGTIMTLDQGVPWIRTGEELDHEWNRLSRHATLLPARQDVGDDGLTGGLKALLGVLGTARWCLGRDSMTPISDRRALVTGAAIKAELARAEAVMNSRQGSWEYATGVVMWLLWVTGAVEETIYLGW